MDSESGLPIEPVYGPDALAGTAPATGLGEPGEFPFTRGVYPTMYTSRPWTMRQYAGFGTAAESNRRYHQLIEAGTAGLSVAFDLPTQMGYDSDATMALGEVGKVGVAIDSIEDMRVLFDGIPLGQGVDVDDDQRPRRGAPAALPARRRGAGRAGRQAHRHDPERHPQGVHRAGHLHLPAQAQPAAGRRHLPLLQDEIPRWNTISISGYHMAEAGATPVQEIAFTLANAKEYVRAAVESGLDVDAFAPRLSFFFVARTTLLEEVAKFRAARRIWAHIMRDEFGAKNPKSQMLRFHTQTAGVQLTAQQPEVNLVRVAIQALGAVLGGTQSLHTNSYDEAIALPTEKAARLALRTQQVIANETDLTADRRPVRRLVRRRVDDRRRRGGRPGPDEPGRGAGRRGGRHREGLPEGRDRAVGLPHRAGDRQRRARRGRRQQVPHRGRRAVRAAAAGPRRSARRRPPSWPSSATERDGDEVRRRLDDLRGLAEKEGAQAEGGDMSAGHANLLYPLREALRARATVGEVCDALRDVWGVYVPPDAY